MRSHARKEGTCYPHWSKLQGSLQRERQKQAIRRVNADRRRVETGWVERERVPNFGLPVDPLFWSVLVNYLFGFFVVVVSFWAWFICGYCVMGKISAHWICWLSNNFLDGTDAKTLNTATTEKAVNSVHIYQMCMSMGFKLGPCSYWTSALPLRYTPQLQLVLIFLIEK